MLCPTRGLFTDLKLCIMVVHISVFQNKVYLSQPCDLFNSSLAGFCMRMVVKRILSFLRQNVAGSEFCHIGKLIPFRFSKV